MASRRTAQSGAGPQLPAQHASRETRSAARSAASGAAPAAPSVPAQPASGASSRIPATQSAAAPAERGRHAGSRATTPTVTPLPSRGPSRVRAPSTTRGTGAPSARVTPAALPHAMQAPSRARRGRMSLTGELVLMEDDEGDGGREDGDEDAGRNVSNNDDEEIIALQEVLGA